MRLITGIGSVVLAACVVGTADAQNADLQVEKSGPATASPSGAIYYNIRVTNLGPDTADGPQLIDVFPAGWTIDFFNDDGSGWECMVLKSIPGEIVCEAPSLNPGGYADFQLSISDPGMTSSPGDTVTNTATVSSATLDPDPSNDVSSVNTLLADATNVQVLKDNGVTTVGPGDTVVYTITVAAIDSYSAYQVSVTDIVPPELSSCTWTCAGSACPNASGSGSIEETVDLEYLESDTVVYTLVCTVNALAVGTITNTATATLPPGQVDVNPDDNSATDTDAVVATADLSVTKTDGVTEVVPGGSLTYSIVAMNAGPSPVVGAALADNFPTELDCD